MWAEDPVSCACSVVELPELIQMEARSAAVAAGRGSGSPAPWEIPIALLGVPFPALTFATTIERIEQMIASRQPHYIATANVDFLVQARSDMELHRVLFDADLVICDGQPLVWCSRWLGSPLPERVAGSDLVPELIRLSAEKGYRIFFLGGSPEVAEQAVARMRERHPTVNICGHYSPPYSTLLDMNHEEVAARIKAARPDLLFVSLGCPKAEKWMFMHYRALGVPVSIGVGGTIDFLAERLKRAPVWMRRTGVEWLFRLLQEPGRLYSRYARDARGFAHGMLQQLWHLQWRRPRGVSPPETSIDLKQRTWLRIQPPDIFAQPFIKRDAAIWARVRAHHCLVDLSHVRFIDSVGMGLLLDLRRRLARQDLCLILLHPSRRVRQALAAMRVEHLFLIASDTLAARELILACVRDHKRQITARSSHATLPLVWSGEIVAGNAPGRWSVIQAQLDSFEDYDEPITVDLSGITFIDSTGVGLLLRANKYAAARGATLKFINPSAAVGNVLRISRLEPVLLGTSETGSNARSAAPFTFLDQVKTQLPSFGLRRTGL